MADFTSDIINWIKAVQYRTLLPTDATVQLYLNQLNAGLMTGAQVQIDIETSAPVDDVLSPISRQRGSLRQRADEQG